MPKSKETKLLEKKLYFYLRKLGTYICHEVGLSYYSCKSNEIIDFLTINTKGIWKCYEIKSSKQDFYSKAKHTFIGHFNYYVMTDELYQIVKNDIPNHIGVLGYDGFYLRSIKNSKKQEIKYSNDILSSCMIRSLYREYDKKWKDLR